MAKVECRWGLHLTVWGGFGMILADLWVGWATLSLGEATFDSFGWIWDDKSGLNGQVA